MFQTTNQIMSPSPFVSTDCHVDPFRVFGARGSAFSDWRICTRKGRKSRHRASWGNLSTDPQVMSLAQKNMAFRSVDKATWRNFMSKL